MHTLEAVIKAMRETIGSPPRYRSHFTHEENFHDWIKWSAQMDLLEAAEHAVKHEGEMLEPLR